jgi:AraC-like DNA-binding protein
MRGSAMSRRQFSDLLVTRVVRINRHVHQNAYRMRSDCACVISSRPIFNTDLDATLVAAAVQITPRYVHRLFEGSGETFGQYVLRRRLDETAHRLRDPAHASRSAMEVAFDCGFTDASYFGRCFRRRFGMTPGDYRRSAGT